MLRTAKEVLDRTSELVVEARGLIAESRRTREESRLNRAVSGEA